MPGHPPPYFQPTKFSPAGISFATSSSLTAFERKQSGRAWSWHQNDIILFDATTDRTYAAAIDVPTGDQIIAIHNAAGVHQSDITITDGVFPSDDHNAPAQAFFDGKYFVGYAGHNDDNNLYLRESTDTTPENLGSVTTINTGFPVTYAQFAEVSGTLYVSCRSGSIREEWFLVSADRRWHMDQACERCRQYHANLYQPALQRHEFTHDRMGPPDHIIRALSRFDLCPRVLA